MKAILVKQVGPTNSRGSRFIASCYLGKVTVPYDYSLNSFENLLVAAIELCKKYSLDYNQLNSVGIVNHDTSVFTFSEGTDTLIRARTQLAAKAAFIAA